MKEVQIRKVVDRDMSILIEIARTTFDITYRHLNDPAHFDEYMSTAFSKEQISKEVNDPNSIFYLLWVNENAEGYLKLNRKDAQTEANMEDILEIERIYVSQILQGQGLGSRLVEKAKEVALEENYKELWLGVWEKNQAAIGFYKRLGFVPFGEHDFMLGPDRQRDILMKMSL